MIARYAAYPQIFWLVVNDAHYGPEYPKDGVVVDGGTVEGGAYREMVSPWKGTDIVLHLVQKNKSDKG